MGPACLPHQTEGIERLARERMELLAMVLHPIHDLFVCVDAETAADGTVLRREQQVLRRSFAITLQDNPQIDGGLSVSRTCALTCWPSATTAVLRSHVDAAANKDDAHAC